MGDGGEGRNIWVSTGGAGERPLSNNINRDRDQLEPGEFLAGFFLPNGRHLGPLAFLCRGEESAGEAESAQRHHNSLRSRHLNSGGRTMVEILKFIRPEMAFDPESIQVLASALDDAWDRIEKSDSPFAAPAYARAKREVIAKRIIEMAKRGAKDPQTLADDAVRFFATNYTTLATASVAAADRDGNKSPKL
jgi:hypothetical protein